MAAISCSVQPASASRRAAAFRSPWAEQWCRFAISHCSRNQFPNPAAVKGLPNSVTRKVICPAVLAHRVQVSVYRDRLLGAGLELTYVQHAVANILAAHTHHVRAPLPRVEQ